MLKFAMAIKMFLILLLTIEVQCHWNVKLTNSYPAFDPKFYEEKLDPEQCQQQLHHMRKNIMLAFQFTDASAKLPRNVLGGNVIDMGNYHQCLSINHKIQAMEIQGKYCSILVNIDNSVKDNATKAPSKLLSVRSKLYKLGLHGQKIIKQYNDKLKTFKALTDIYNKDSLGNEDFSTLEFKVHLGICIPKVCSTDQAMNSYLLNMSNGSVYVEDFCRLPHDKPWSPADTFAVVIFSIIGILTLLCTGYDVISKFLLKTDSTEISRYLKIFSVYTNGRHLVSFSYGPDTLRCLDGIRVMATAWVVLGHTAHTQIKILNVVDMLKWGRSLHSIYVITAPLTVDTFFTIGGILLVYCNCGKLAGKQFLKNLHVFYLNRLLRMFPLLATVVLLQASFFHRISDGPMWQTVATATDNCRTHWWITLLYVQNLINSSMKCLGHSWYLAIDVQLYIISPLVLFWVFGRSKKTAWIALTACLIITLSAATVYNFNRNFLPHIISPEQRIDEMDDYLKYYYVITLTRASPFFIGMMFGYTLYIFKGKQLYLSRLSVTLLWSWASLLLTVIFFSVYFVTQEDWKNQFINNILNSFMRPAWGLAIGWMVFACVHGYGGPVNWFLSLDMWRLLARLCYGVYLFHYPIIFIVSDSVISTVFFSPVRVIFMFTAYLTISFLVSYFAHLLIDAPFSIVFKMIIVWLSPKKKKTYTL